MRVLNFQRMSTEDGPGLRTTVFFKGCPLKCAWCHNPESIALNPHIEWLSVRCMGCGSCVKECKRGVYSINNGLLIQNSEKCVVCGKCVEECPTGALEQKGSFMTVEEVFNEVVKDKAYWGINGGVTLSGGEVLMQSKEAGELLRMLKNNGIHTAVDTCGFCKQSDIDNVFENSDMFLYDIKIYDSEQHKKFTAVHNEIILSNFEYLCEKVKGTKKKILVRTPIIPEATESDDNISNIAKFLSNKDVEWEMCAFNNLCLNKYERLHTEWKYKGKSLITKKRMNELKAIANEYKENAFWSGMTKLEV